MPDQTVKISQTISECDQTMPDDQLLFPALDSRCHLLHKVKLTVWQQNNDPYMYYMNENHIKQILYGHVTAVRSNLCRSGKIKWHWT